MKIVADAHIPFVADYFGHAGELILKPGRSISHADVKDADLLLVRSITPVNQQLLNNTTVKWVGSMTTGHDHLDIDWLNQAGIAWSLAAGFNAKPAAEYVLSVIAALTQRQLLPPHFKAAVIGVGRIGQLIVERLKYLKAEVLRCDPLRAATEADFVSTSLAGLSNCDLITLHVPLTRETPHPTYHLIDHHFLKRQKKNTVIINASRGTVCDETAILKNQQGYFCLDVFEQEPEINPAILQLATIATPHIAGYSVQSKYRGIAQIYQAAISEKVIPDKSFHLAMPHLALDFNNQLTDWSSVVLKVFDPFCLSHTLKTAPQNFDHLRHHFKTRHEFEFVTLKRIKLSSEDQLILQQLGFKIKN